MKTLKQVQDKIKNIVEENKNLGVLDPKRKRVNLNLNLLRQVEKYLLSTPTEEFIKREIENLELKLTVINERKEEYKQMYDKLSENEINSYFEKEYNIKTMKKQLKVLKYINK